VATSTSLIETVASAVDASGVVSAFQAAAAVDADVLGFFSWVNKIIAYVGDNKKELELIPTTDDDGYLYFAFNTEDRAIYYVWDPSVGTTAVIGSSNTGAASLAQVSWIATIFLAIAMLL